VARPTDVQKEINKIADRLLEEFASRGGQFELTDVIQAARPELEPLGEVALEAMVVKAVKEADKRARKDRDAKQMTFAWAVEGIFALGENARVAKRFATLYHIQVVKQLKADNLLAVQSAYIAFLELVDKLMPYLSKAGCTMQQAVAQYEAEHPQEDAA
jgi:hypothetical protein